jgi:hypothetical protein
MSGERGLDVKALTYLLGLVAMFAGFATMVFSSSRLMIDLFGGAVLLGGFGSTAWPSVVMSSPRPMRYAPRIQAFSPCRGSDPASVRKPRHHGEPALGETRSRSKQMSRITNLLKSITPPVPRASTLSSRQAPACKTSACRVRYPSASSATPGQWIKTEP